jgi:hypothetical protein
MVAYKKEFFLNITFYAFLCILLTLRVLLFLSINIDYIDSDQPFMWAGVKDYSEGLFYEPRFYGQDYNTFMESLFAVPLYWLSVPVYYALPIATHFVALFPFLFTAFYLFYKGRKENALVVLAISLCMTTGYHVMTSLPRGVSGVFFSGLFILSFLNPTHLRFLTLNTFLSVLAYFVTPNSVLVSVPLLVFLFFYNYKNRAYYLATGLTFLTIIPLYFVFDKFYKDHPDYVIYGLNNHITFDYFFEALSHLDKHFAHVSFFFEERSLILLVILLVLAIALFKTSKAAFLAFLSFLSIVLFSFCTTKVQEGVIWPFYSFSRMYIGIPVLIVLFSVLFPFRSRFLLPLLVIVTLSFSLLRFIHFKSSIRYHTDEKRWNGVHLVPLHTVLEACQLFGEACKTNKANYLLISNTFWLSTYINYGGQGILKDFPLSQETEAERRYWVREGNKNKVFKRFVFISVDYDFEKHCSQDENFQIKRLNDYGLFLIENNTLQNKDFISLVTVCEGK